MCLVALILQQKRCNKVKNERYLQRTKKIHDASNSPYSCTGTYRHVFVVWCIECWLYNGSSICKSRWLLIPSPIYGWGCNPHVVQGNNLSLIV